MDLEKVEELKNDSVEIPESYFLRFKAECLRVAGVLGLNHFSLYFEHEKTDGTEATIIIDYEANAATLAYGKTCSKSEFLQINPETAAKHEISHLLTSRLVWMAENQKHSKMISQEDEAIANRLEKVL